MLSGNVLICRSKFLKYLSLFYDGTRVMSVPLHHNSVRFSFEMVPVSLITTKALNNCSLGFICL